MTINTSGAIAHLQWHRWEDLEAQYDDEHPTAPYLAYTDNELSKFSFDINHWLYFYVEMHRLSDDTKWLDLAEDTCQYFIDNNDVARLARGDFVLNGATPGVDRYWQAPYSFTNDAEPVPGWSGADGAPSLRVQILQDGQIIGAMAYYADYILDNNLTAYTTNANAFFAHVKLVIDSHERSWRDDKVSTSPPITVEGAWYYPERINGDDTVFSEILPFNHAAGACQALLLYHKHFTDLDYLDKAERFMEFTRSNRAESNNMFQWNYSVETAGSEDLNHGSYTFQFFMTAAANGYLDFTSAELSKYANSAVNGWQGTSVGDLSEFFDGQGTIPAGEVFDPSHFVDIAKYNSLVFKITKEAHAVNSKSQPAYSRMFRGAATLLRYQTQGSLL